MNKKLAIRITVEDTILNTDCVINVGTWAIISKGATVGHKGWTIEILVIRSFITTHLYISIQNNFVLYKIIEIKTKQNNFYKIILIKLNLNFF